jgi:hypothetical protein
MEPDELEFLLTQYLDGDLPPDRKSFVEKLLAEDPHARAQLDIYRKLDQTLRTAMPLPAIRWHLLAKHISSAVAYQSAPAPAYKFPRAWIAPAAAVTAALAACLLIAFALTHHQERSALIPNNTTALGLLPTGSSQVIGPQIESPAGQSLATVTLDPAPRMASAFDAYPFAEGVVAQPSHVFIAGPSGNGLR